MNQKRIITILPILFIICSIVLIGILYFLNNNGAFNISTSENTFTDKTLDFEIIYPSNWNVEVSNQLSEETIQTETGVLGPVVTEFRVALTNGEDSFLNFRKILVNAQGSVKPLDKSEFDYEIFEDKIIRYKEKGSETYSYTNYTPCSEVPKVLIASKPNAEACAGSFIQNFGKYPTLITLKSSNESFINQADEVIKNILLK